MWFIERLVDSITKPSKVYEEAGKESTLRAYVYYIVFSSVLIFLSFMIRGGAVAVTTPSILLAYALLAPVLATIVYGLWMAMVIYIGLTAELFGEKGEVGHLLRSASYATTASGIFSLIVSIIGSNPVIGFVLGIASIVIGLLYMEKAVKSVYRTSTAKAWLVVLFPGIVLVIASVIFVILMGAAINSMTNLVSSIKPVM